MLENKEKKATRQSYGEALENLGEKNQDGKKNNLEL